MTEKIRVRVEKPNGNTSQTYWMGRNGMAQNWGIAAWGSLEGRVFLDLLCSRGALAGAGGLIEVEVLDEFCSKWLEARAAQAPSEHREGIDDAGYVRNPGRCPYCGCSDITGDAWEAEGDETTQEVTCSTCDRQWYDLYKLVGYIDR